MAELLFPDPHAADVPAPIPAALLGLAALYLPNHRTTHYIGDDQCTRLANLTADDQARLRHLYELLTNLLLVIGGESADATRRWPPVAGWLHLHPVDALIDEVRALGVSSLATTPGVELSKVMHDVRGGPLSALLSRLQMVDQLAQDEGNLQTLFVLARDHLKIMRCALLGLDDPRREEDHLPKSHDVRLVLEKWRASVVGPRPKTHPVRLFIDCRYEGALSECCLESAAIDRIFYNLANNACRHSASERLDMMIFPLPQTPSECLRLVLSNSVSVADAGSLQGVLDASADRTDKGAKLNLEALFAPRISSTGSGFGLTVVADFVVGAFGLRDRAQALEERYVGAMLDGGVFRVWFHWPIANDALPPKLEDGDRPPQNLDEP